MTFVIDKLRICAALLGAAAALFGQAAYGDTVDNPWLNREMTREDLLAPMEQAADYLLRHQLADGQFVYLKDPLGKCCRSKPEAYSLIRHLGAVYALLRAYEIDHAAEYLASAERGIAFAARFMQKEADKVGSLNVVRGMKGKVSIGENGFLLLTTVLYDRLAPQPAHERLSDELAAFVASALVYDGPYATSGQWAESQALIGLMQYYKYRRQDARLLAVARDWLNAMRAEERHSHWSVQAIQAFVEIVPEAGPEFSDYVARAGHLLLEDVLIEGPLKDRRLIGGRKGLFNSCSATARNEGLIACHVVAKTQGLTTDASFFLDRVKEHLAHALQFQYGLTGNLYEDDPDMTRMGELFGMRGGVFDNPKKAYVRIDFVAHHIRAIAAYLGTGSAPIHTGLITAELTD